MDFLMKADFFLKSGGGGMHRNILQQMSTGNVWVDTVIAVAIPIAMHFLLPAGSYNPISGHFGLDVLLLGSIPLIRDEWHGTQERLRASGVSLFYRLIDTYETTIHFEKEAKEWYMTDEGDGADSEEGKRNNILQKAILLYIGSLGLEYRRSQALLTAVKHKPDAEGNGRPRRRDTKVYGGSAEQLMRFNVNIAPPKKIWVQVDKENGIYFRQTKNTIPAAGNRSSSENQKTVTNIEYTFRCARRAGNQKVEAFINKAFEWYIGEMRSTEDNARYMYKPVATPPPKKKKKPGMRMSDMGEDENDDKEATAAGPLRYKRYKLTGNKDFDSLFFPEKDKLLKILGNFEAKKSRYAIKGYPHKLGLLLHGPPGTGKTSLIKALASHTGRHIVQVPLGLIKTNQDLMNIMFDQSFAVARQELAVSLKHEDVIFVFEDVDVATRIVKARKGVHGVQNTGAGSRPAAIASPEGGASSSAGGRSTSRAPRKSGSGNKGESKSKGKIKSRNTKITGESVAATGGGDGDTPVVPLSPSTSGDETVIPEAAEVVIGGELQGTPVVGSEGKKEGVEQVEAAEEEGTNESVKGKVAAEGEDEEGGKEEVGESSGDEDSEDESGSEDESDSDDEEAEEATAKKGQSNKKKQKKKTKVKYADKHDKLDLSGLLNALDGVVDTPGRLVVFTTNVIECLDPALIRPGRIDKPILLGYMKYEAALQMTMHFFPEERESLTDEQKSRLEAVFSEESAARRRRRHNLPYSRSDGGQLTPATVEQIMGEHEKVDDFLDALESK